MSINDVVARYLQTWNEIHEPASRMTSAPRLPGVGAAAAARPPTPIETGVA